jgi:hypothetical protein
VVLLCPCLLSFYPAACVEFPAAVAVDGVEVAVPLEPSSAAPAS